MIVKSCIHCKYHAIKTEGNDQTSHCQKENCWSRFSKCILYKALENYLKENSYYSEESSAPMS